LALLVVVMLGVGFVARRIGLAEADGRLSVDELRIPALRAVIGIAIAAVIALLVVAIVAGERRPSANPATGATASRLTSLQSHRYAYWKVAAGAFADHPLDGLGSGNFQVRWLAKRKFREAALDAHSLYIETAAELRIVGLAALAAWIAGVVLAASATLRRDAGLGAARPHRGSRSRPARSTRSRLRTRSPGRCPRRTSRSATAGSAGRGRSCAVRARRRRPAGDRREHWRSRCRGRRTAPKTSPRCRRRAAPGCNRAATARASR